MNNNDELVNNALGGVGDVKFVDFEAIEKKVMAMEANGETKESIDSFRFKAEATLIDTDVTKAVEAKLPHPEVAIVAGLTRCDVTDSPDIHIRASRDQLLDFAERLTDLLALKGTDSIKFCFPHFLPNEKQGSLTFVIEGDKDGTAGRETIQGSEQGASSKTQETA